MYEYCFFDFGGSTLLQVFCVKIVTIFPMACVDEPINARKLERQYESQQNTSNLETIRIKVLDFSSTFYLT
jgi:hypothetical protein